MYGGIRITTSANASSSPWIELDGHRGAARPSSSAEGVDEQVELDAARRLDEHDVAVAQPRPQHVQRRLAVARRGGCATASRPASRRTVHDPARLRRRRRRADRPSAPAASPTARCPASWPSPSSSISPSTATRRPGSRRAGPAPRPPTRRRVVAVVDDRRRPAAGRARRDAARTSRRASAVDDRVAGRARPPARPRRRPARCGPTAGPAPGWRPGAPRPASADWKRIPRRRRSSRPRRATSASSAKP